jgi:hypothetical protein
MQRINYYNSQFSMKDGQTHDRHICKSNISKMLSNKKNYFANHFKIPIVHVQGIDYRTHS